MMLHNTAHKFINFKKSTLKEPTEGADISYSSYRAAPEYCPVAFTYTLLWLQLLIR